MDEPEFPVITHISCLLEELSLHTLEWIFILTVECSSWKSSESLSLRLILRSDEYTLIWQDRNDKGSSRERDTFESLHRSVIHLLIPLVDITTDSGEYFLSMFWYFFWHDRIFVLVSRLLFLTLIFCDFESHIEWLSLLSHRESVDNLPSLRDSDTIEHLSHLRLEEWREIVPEISKSDHDRRECLIESDLLLWQTWIELPWLLLIDILIELSRECEAHVKGSLEIIGLHIPHILRDIVISLPCYHSLFIGSYLPTIELQGEGE